MSMSEMLQHALDSATGKFNLRVPLFQIAIILVLGSEILPMSIPWFSIIYGIKSAIKITESGGLV